MKILIIGGGSIGQRHVQNALALADEVALCDVDESRLSGVDGIEKFTSIDKALAWGAEGVVVAVPHHLHIEVATKVVEAGSVPLIEKPLSHSLDGVQDFLNLAQGQDIPAYVVCNMRFHQAVQALKDNLSRVGDVMYTRAQFGNYLPNMRPDADYKALYCAHKAQGGGVILDAIHEVNYLSWLLGPIKTVGCEADKRSALDIDVEDYAALVLAHESGVRSEIHLDYLQQVKRRGCEIIGSKGTLIWQSEDKNPEHCLVRFYDAQSKSWEVLYEDNDLDMGHMYKELMSVFIEELKAPGSKAELLTAQEALKDLKVCLAAHKASDSGQRQEI